MQGPFDSRISDLSEIRESNGPVLTVENGVLLRTNHDAENGDHIISKFLFGNNNPTKLILGPQILIINNESQDKDIDLFSRSPRDPLLDSINNMNPFDFNSINNNRQLFWDNNMNQNALDSLNQSLEELKGIHYKADMDYLFQKAELDGLKYLYEDEIVHSSHAHNDEHDFQYKDEYENSLNVSNDLKIIDRKVLPLVDVFL